MRIIMQMDFKIDITNYEIPADLQKEKDKQVFKTIETV